MERLKLFQLGRHRRRRSQRTCRSIRCARWNLRSRRPDLARRLSGQGQRRKHEEHQSQSGKFLYHMTSKEIISYSQASFFQIILASKVIINSFSFESTLVTVRQAQKEIIIFVFQNYFNNMVPT